MIVETTTSRRWTDLPIRARISTTYPHSGLYSAFETPLKSFTAVKTTNKKSSKQIGNKTKRKKLKVLGSVWEKQEILGNSEYTDPTKVIECAAERST
jgi:hypothetical protein